MNQGAIFADQFETPDIHIRIPAQKDVAHACHAVPGNLHEIFRVDPYAGILLLRIAEKRPVELRLVGVFAPVQVEDRNGAPGQKDR